MTSDCGCSMLVVIWEDKEDRNANGKMIKRGEKDAKEAWNLLGDNFFMTK